MMLAAAWLFQAHPDRAEAARGNWYERCMQERAMRHADPVLNNRSFQFAPGCGGNAPGGWDEHLVLRALLAAAVGVALLMLAAMIPRARTDGG